MMGKLNILQLDTLLSKRASFLFATIDIIKQKHYNNFKLVSY